MRVSLLVLIVALTAGVVAPLQHDTAVSPEMRVEWTEFKKLYDTKKIEVVDVRGEDAYALGHIPGARSVPLDLVEKRAAQLRKLKKPVVTYCQCPAEHSSLAAAELLKKKGVYARALVGGYDVWLRHVGRVDRGKEP